MTDPGRRPGRGPEPVPEGDEEPLSSGPRSSPSRSSGPPSDPDGADPGAPSVETIRFWYRRHADRVYRYARWRSDDRETAEAVVSDVFLEAWRSSDDYDPERGSVESWLLGIARNVLRRERRRRARGAESLDPADLEDLAAPGPSPEDEALREERRRRLLEAVWALPCADRDLVALAYGAELSSRRIARLLETTPGAVRTRLHRVLRALREELAGG